ncbi:hypothetical protein SAMN05446037_101327 [Anaerovirgula multivorans]|uniref:Uncharacterized protein n=1 Tax=Anaerovirgula multivorans TaxID=312168 RepID=A0A239FHS6_9FIRM|nr:hypothetical protein [Anaerovirgula multivorans]SNS56590.1 hypothetical protein SAMN05446037_101327 [Anaerovirgula multivorans]
MEYFVIKQDNRVTSPLKIDSSTIDIDTEEPFVVYADFHPTTTFVDYFCKKKLFNHYFCVSDALKEMLEIYADNMTAIPFFVTDKEQKGQKIYWKIDLELQDCLEIHSQMRYDNLAIIKEKIKSKYIFKVAFQKQEYLIVSLHLAENILRKNLCGIQFIPVSLK